MVVARVRTLKKPRYLMAKRTFPTVFANSIRFNLVKLFRLDGVFFKCFSDVLFWPVGGLQHLRRLGLASVGLWKMFSLVCAVVRFNLVSLAVVLPVK